MKDASGAGLRPKPKTEPLLDIEWDEPWAWVSAGLVVVVMVVLAARFLT